MGEFCNNHNLSWIVSALYLRELPPEGPNCFVPLSRGHDSWGLSPFHLRILSMLTLGERNKYWPDCHQSFISLFTNGEQTQPPHNQHINPQETRQDQIFKIFYIHVISTVRCSIPPPTRRSIHPIHPNPIHL